MTTNSANINSTGLPIFDSSTGDFSSTALTAKGDLLTYDTGYNRLPVGVNNKILLADSGQATGNTWGDIPFTGNLVLLDTVQASSSTSIDFTDLDPTTYHSFFIFITSAHPATDNVSFQLLFSTNNGVSFIGSGYEWVYEISNTGSGTSTQQFSASSSSIQASDSIGNTGGEGIAGWFWYMPSDNPTQFRNSCEWQLYSQDTGTNLESSYGSGLNSTTSTVDALRIQFSSGAIEAGTFYLYGYEA